MKQKPNNVESSIWYIEEISDPYQVIAEFFSAADLYSSLKNTKDMLLAASSETVYKKDAPGNLLYHYNLLESLINAADLINKKKKKSSIEIRDGDILNARVVPRGVLSVGGEGSHGAEKYGQRHG